MAPEDMAEEIFELGMQDIDALSAYLGDKSYFMGDKPTGLDASAFGFLINTLGCPISPRSRNMPCQRRI